MLMHRTRANYWSNSVFAKWVARRFGGYEMPTGALSMEDWGDWKKATKAKAPRTFWFIEDVLDRAQDVVHFPDDVYDNVRVYCRNRWGDRLDVLPTRLPKGQFHELDTRLLHGMFEGLVDFIECEKAWMTVAFDDEAAKKYPGLKRPWYLRWKYFRCPQAGLDHLAWKMTLGDPSNEHPMESQAAGAKEQLALYQWWKARPNRPDPFVASGMEDFYNKTMDANYGDGWIWKRKGQGIPDVFIDRLKELRDITEKMEQQFDAEDEEMMIRLVKIRRSLWT